ncbi:GDP-mannose 4,6-dehydratase [bacterium]|nr:GDP-mannose 4,6-dehydratase [bacterium]MCI0607087.1 GDP-mannose 4,6-dehydratase [bacterium]
MKALITGGAGFIGSHLAEKLMGMGHSVDVIDDLSTGNIRNMSGCQGKAEFRFIHGSVMDEGLMHMLIDRNDMVYHLAAAVGVSLIVKQPVRTIETNIKGTEVVLEIAKKFRKRVLLASSSEVYGKSEKVPFSENDDCVLGSTSFSRWSYACSKAIDEFLGLAYHRQFGLPVLILRFFNTVGERQTGQYGMVIPRFVKAALRGEPIQVYGDGKQTRCFAHVKDVVNGMIALTEDAGSYGHVYNIGSIEEISIEDLAIRIKALTGSNSEIRYVPYEEAYSHAFDDLRRRVPSLDKIQKRVGYKPVKTLDEILKTIIEWMRAEPYDDK